MTNPPFGSKIRIRGAQVLDQYDLAHKWRRIRAESRSRRTSYSLTSRRSFYSWNGACNCLSPADGSESCYPKAFSATHPTPMSCGGCPIR